MKNKILWIDLETGGVDPIRNGILQIGMVVDIEGQELEKYQFNVKPLESLDTEDKALEVTGLTRDQIKTFTPEKEVYSDILEIYKKHIDSYDRSDKFIVAGYNVDFDIRFMHSFWKRMKDNYLFSFFGMKMDIMQLVAILKWNKKINIDSWKLTDLAKYFDLTFNAHNALEDILMTRQIAIKLNELLKG